MFADPVYHVALVAGMLAAFNPCGFALLPAYLTLVITRRAIDTSTAAALGRAVTMTLAMTAGFVTVFGAFGLIVVPLTLSIESALPWATVAVGLALIALGSWLATGHELILSTPRITGAAPDRSLGSMALYGMAYAIASLSCTVAPFLALTTTTFRSTGVIGGLLAFVAYGIGMGLVVGTLAAAVALGHNTVVRSARKILPYLNRTSGVLVILAGTYVTYYGIYELRLNDDGSTTDPIIDAVLDTQRELTRRIDEIGPGPIAITLTALLTIGVGATIIRRRLKRRTRPTTQHTDS